MATAKRSLERGVNRNQNQITRELPYYEYDPSLAYKNSLKERKSNKTKGGKGKKKKCKGKKSKGKGKKSKEDCDEYWSPDEKGGYESTNERPWSPVSQAYPEYPSPSPYYGDRPEPTPYPVAEAQDSPTEWTPSAPYWYYSPTSPISPAAWDYPTAGAQEDPTSKPTASPTKDPTSKPTATPTSSPTDSPTAKPTDSPTLTPVEQSEAQPVQITIVVPTVAPSGKYQVQPVEWPTIAPTGKYQVKPVEWPTIAPSKGPDPTLAPYEVVGSDASPSSPSAWWSPVWFPSEFMPETASWKTEPIQSGGEMGAMSTCETTPPDSTTVEVLEFTYEMFLTFGTNNPADITREIENLLHHELATRLLDCDFGTSSENVDDFEFTTVVSLPKDTLTSNECSNDVEMDGTECYVIVGRITVSIIESQHSLDDMMDGMETVMKDLMHGPPASRRRELQQSPLLEANPAIQGLYFRGFVTNGAASASTRGESSQAQASSSKTVVGAVSLAAAAVIVVLGGLLVFRRRQTNRAYLDVSSDCNSRIGIQARADSPASLDTKPIGQVITDDASDFDLSVYTNTGNSASEDMSPLPDISGVDIVPIGISPKEGPSQTSTAHFPIVSPELAKTQEIARLPEESSVSIAQSSISVAYSEDAHPFRDTVDV